MGQLLELLQWEHLPSIVFQHTCIAFVNITGLLPGPDSNLGSEIPQDQATILDPYEYKLSIGKQTMKNNQIMMTAKDYIEEKLRMLKSTFADIQIRYEHDPVAKSHLVEIIPSYFKEGNEDYFKEEAKIVDEFNQLYPDDSLDFISKDSSIKIEDADLELGFDQSRQVYW